ncbi:MAG: hypothetical protein WC455_14070 [Dehalococcoidia bacterium]|jgi:hypothetical protein
MKVKCLSLIAGPWGVFNRGEVGDFPDNVAVAMINAKAAEQIGEDKPIAESKTDAVSIEVATLPEAEQAETETYPPRRRRKTNENM